MAIGFYLITLLFSGGLVPLVQSAPQASSALNDENTLRQECRIYTSIASRTEGGMVDLPIELFAASREDCLYRILDGAFLGQICRIKRDGSEQVRVRQRSDILQRGDSYTNLVRMKSEICHIDPVPRFLPLESFLSWGRRVKNSLYLSSPSRSNYIACKNWMRDNAYSLPASGFPSLGDNAGTKFVIGIGNVPDVDFSKMLYTEDLSIVAFQPGHVPQWQVDDVPRPDHYQHNLELYHNHMRYLEEHSGFPLKDNRYAKGVCRSKKGGCYGGCTIS